MTGAALAALALLVATEGGTVRIPRLDGPIAAAMPKAAAEGRAPEVSIGGIGLSVDPSTVSAGLTLDNVRLLQGDLAVHLPRVITALDIGAGLGQMLRPRALQIQGGAVQILRDSAGHLSIGAADSGPMMPLMTGRGAPRADLGTLVSGMAGGKAPPLLAALERVELSGVAIGFRDERGGQRWEATDAEASVIRRDGRGTARLRAEIAGAAAEPTGSAADASADLSTGASRLRFRITNARPADLASQFRALDWLAQIDAPVDAHIAVELAPDETLTRMDAVLALGAGTLASGTGAPLPFELA